MSFGGAMIRDLSEFNLAQVEPIDAFWNSANKVLEACFLNQPRDDTFLNEVSPCSIWRAQICIVAFKFSACSDEIPSEKTTGSRLERQSLLPFAYRSVESIRICRERVGTFIRFKENHSRIFVVLFSRINWPLRYSVLQITWSCPILIDGVCDVNKPSLCDRLGSGVRDVPD